MAGLSLYLVPAGERCLGGVKERGGPEAAEGAGGHSEDSAEGELRQGQICQHCCPGLPAQS